MYKLNVTIQTAVRIVLDYVNNKGYRFDGTEKDQFNYAVTVLDYLSDNNETTLDEWFRTTLENYPEDLVKLN